MALKTFYKVLSILSVVFGIALFFEASNVKILGSVIDTSNITNSTNIGFAMFFLVAGIVLFIAQKKDKKL